MRKQVTILAAAAALGGLLAVSSVSKAHALGYTFTDIDVPGSLPGSTGFFVPGINNVGQVVGSYVDSAGNVDGFLYSGGKYVTVDAPGAIDTTVAGINDLGQIVGTAFYSNGSSYNFIDTRGKFTSISDASAFSPYEINDRDQVFGLDNNDNGVVLNAKGVLSPVNTSGAPGSASPSGFNNLDQFTGSLEDSAGAFHAFVDTNGHFTTIDDPDAAPGLTVGSGINDLGQVAGYFFDSAEVIHGFVDTNGHFTTIDDPDAFAAFGYGTQPLVINDLGQVVGWAYTENSVEVFLATPKLDLFAFAQSAPLSDPVPEPSTWAMMAVGFAGLGWLARVRRRNLRPA